jgi:hypothetical protein
MALAHASAMMESVPVSYLHIRRALRVNGETLHQVSDVSEGDSCTTNSADIRLLWHLGP